MQHTLTIIFAARATGKSHLISNMQHSRFSLDGTEYAHNALSLDRFDDGKTAAVRQRSFPFGVTYPRVNQSLFNLAAYKQVISDMETRDAVLYHHLTEVLRHPQTRGPRFGCIRHGVAVFVESVREAELAAAAAEATGAWETTVFSDMYIRPPLDQLAYMASTGRGLTPVEGGALLSQEREAAYLRAYRFSLSTQAFHPATDPHRSEEWYESVARGAAIQATYRADEVEFAEWVAANFENPASRRPTPAPSVITDPALLPPGVIAAIGHAGPSVPPEPASPGLREVVLSKADVLEFDPRWFGLSADAPCTFKAL